MKRAKNKDTYRETVLKEQWQDYTKAWQASGDTQVPYYRQHWLYQHAFYYWILNLQKGRTTCFVEISGVTRPSSGAVIEIFIDSGIQICGPHGVDTNRQDMAWTIAVYRRRKPLIRLLRE